MSILPEAHSVMHKLTSGITFHPPNLQRRPKMRKTFTAAMIALAAMAQTPATAEEAPDLVTILTSEDPQTQLMSMVLTMQSLKQGSTTYTLLCGPGGDLALRDAPAAATAPQKPKGMSPQGLMRMIMDQGGTVEVCAIYLPNKGVG